MNVAEKIEPVVTNPVVSKAVATYATGSGAAVYFEMLDSWLAIASVLVGIFAGLTVIFFNLAKINHEKIESAKLKREQEIHEERSRIEIEMLQYELEKMKEGKTNENKVKNS